MAHTLGQLEQASSETETSLCVGTLPCCRSPLGIGRYLIGHPCDLPSTFQGNSVDTLLRDIHPSSQNWFRYTAPVAARVLGKTVMGHGTSLTKQGVLHVDPELTDLCGRLQIGQNEQQLQRRYHCQVSRYRSIPATVNPLEQSFNLHLSQNGSDWLFGEGFRDQC